MNIVVVSARLPYPLDKGDRLTVYHFLRYFSQRHRVSLACFLEPEQEARWVEQVAPFCRRVELVPLRRWRACGSALAGVAGRIPLQLRYYADPAMRAAVERLVREEEPDLLYAQLVRMGPYIEPYRDRVRVAAFNLSMTLNHRRLAQHASGWLGRAFHSLEYRKLKAFEGPFARQFDGVLLISRHDLEAVAQGRPLDNAFVVPHGVDCAHFAPNGTADKRPGELVLTGNMNYAPNVDAAMWFCGEVLPRIRAKVPRATLSIVGADPAPKVRALAREPGIEVTGRVPDLRPYMGRAEVALAPIRIGAGLQNKVLEGMSMGLPMVITPVANEGIRAVHGENVVVADGPEAFADETVALLGDPERRRRLGLAAREFIVRHWSWETHFAEQERIFLGLVEAKRRSVTRARGSDEVHGAQRAEH